MSNRYVLLRHGQSEANAAGIIASRPENADRAYGLTPAGREQVQASIQDGRARGLLPGPCRVVTSPLLRAVESARVAAELLGEGVHLDRRLAERDFGTLELTSDERYREVWLLDARDPTQSSLGVESIASVAGRAGSLVRELEASLEDHTVVLCTHGDVASALYCTSLGLSLARHREVGALGNAELRVLGRAHRWGEGAGEP